MGLPKFVNKNKTNMSEKEKPINSPKSNLDPFAASRKQNLKEEKDEDLFDDDLYLDDIDDIVDIDDIDDIDDNVDKDIDKKADNAKKNIEKIKKQVQAIQEKAKETIQKEVKEETKEVKETKKTKETKKVREVKETEEAKETEEVKGTEEVKEAKVTEKTKEAKKAKEAQKEIKNNTDAPQTILVPFNTFTDFESTVLSIFKFKDPEWEAFKKRIDERLNTVLTDKKDITPEKVKEILATVNSIRAELWKRQSDIQAFYDDLASEKPEGFIEQVKKLNLIGANEDQRRRNAVTACMYYKTDNGTINLYELCAAAREQLIFLNTAMKMCQDVAYSCVTMNNSITNELKLEQ